MPDRESGLYAGKRLVKNPSLYVRFPSTSEEKRTFFVWKLPGDYQ